MSSVLSWAPCLSMYANSFFAALLASSVQLWRPGQRLASPAKTCRLHPTGVLGGTCAQSLPFASTTGGVGRHVVCTAFSCLFCQARALGCHLAHNSTIQIIIGSSARVVCEASNCSVASRVNTVISMGTHVLRSQRTQSIEIGCTLLREMISGVLR